MMTTKRLATLFAGVSMLAIAGTAAVAEGSVSIWKRLPQWVVAIDQTQGGGCFMQAHYPVGTGTFLRAGLDDRTKNGYIMLFNEDWGTIVAGQAYVVQAKFDDFRLPGWSTWHAVGMHMEQGQPGLRIDFTNVQIFEAVMFSSAVHITYQGNPVINGNLPGSAAAATEMVACEKAVGGLDDKQPDPFRPAGPVARRDPFRL